MAVGCQENTRSLKLSKKKELIMDYKKQRAEQAPILIDGAEVEQIEFQVPWCPHHQRSIMVQTLQDSHEDDKTFSPSGD